MYSGDAGTAAISMKAQKHRRSVLPASMSKPTMRFSVKTTEIGIISEQSFQEKIGFLTN
jgi:hypothetical protein